MIPLLLAVAISAPDCSSASTPVERNVCTAQSATRAEDELRAAFDDALRRLLHAPRRSQELQRAQLAWQQQVDLKCEAEAGASGPEARSEAANRCEEREARARAERLRNDAP